MNENEIDELKNILRDLIGDNIDIDYLISSAHNRVLDEFSNKSITNLLPNDLEMITTNVLTKVERDINLRYECLESPNLLQINEDAQAPSAPQASSAPPLEHMRSIINLKEYFNPV